jgi:sterol 3beta-glucosyltransferase
VYDVWEGIDNLPGMIGSDVREKGKITNFRSGCREAGLGLGYGIWDGLTGLVTEPMIGAKRDGMKGAFIGAGKSCKLPNVHVTGC